MWLTCMRRKPQVHPIAAVEIEISPWSYEEETAKGEQILATSYPLAGMQTN